MKHFIVRTTLLATLSVGALWIAPAPARAHCDTLDGPVVRDARTALARRDVTPALKWVKRQGEAEVRAAFRKALVVRAGGTEARDLADRFFFETLVRVHRAGEGAPYTGLKPAGAVEPPIAAADRALESGSVEALARQVSADVTEGIRRRFAEVREKRQRATSSVQAGRDYVAAYVEYVHYVERLHQDAVGGASHHEGGPEASVPAHGHGG